MSDVGETTVGAVMAIGANGAQADGVRVRGDELEEWFARAATGRTFDEDDTSGCELVGAATLPLRGVLVRPPRPRRVLMGASGVARLWLLRGRGLTLATFSSLALLIVVVVVLMRPISSSSGTATVPEAVDASSSINELGDAIDRSLKITIARQKRAEARRRAAALAQRRRVNEHRESATRRLLAARHHAALRHGGAARGHISTPAAARRAVASARGRRATSQTRRRQLTRRSTCGPFDLC